MEVQCPSTVTRRALRTPLPSSTFLTYNAIRVGTHDLELLPALGFLRFFQQHAPAWQGWGGLAFFTSQKAPIHTSPNSHVYAARIQSMGTVEVRPLLMGKLTE